MKGCSPLLHAFVLLLFAHPQPVATVMVLKSHSAATVKFTLDTAEKLSVLRDHVAEALASPGNTKIEFDSPNWRIPLELGEEEAPYLGNFHKVSSEEGEYDQGHSKIYVSNSQSGVLRGTDWGSPEAAVLPALGFGEGAQTIPSEDAERNVGAKHAVVVVNFPECGYWAHAMDNVFPRVISVWDGARKAGYKLSVVLPSSGRSYFSHNTEVILSELGVDLLDDYPTWPHRVVAVQFVSSWNHFLKRSLQLAFRSTILKGVEPSHCGSDQPARGAYLSRKSGAANGRWVGGSDLVEGEFRKQGWKVYDNMGSLELKDFASELYSGVCTLGGFEGGGMMNLIFLPPSSTVVVLNPGFPYADTWFNAHELNEGFVHIVPPRSSISSEEASRIVSVALAERAKPKASWISLLQHEKASSTLGRQKRIRGSTLMQRLLQLTSRREASAHDLVEL